MVCDDSWKKGLTQTIYMIGMLLGSFLFGWLSDQIGRKLTMMTSLVVLTVGGCLPFFISNYYCLATSR